MPEFTFIPQANAGLFIEAAQSNNNAYHQYNALGFYGKMQIPNIFELGWHYKLRAVNKLDAKYFNGQKEGFIAKMQGESSEYHDFHLFMFQLSSWFRVLHGTILPAHLPEQLFGDLSSGTCHINLHPFASNRYSSILPQQMHVTMLSIFTDYAFLDSINIIYMGNNLTADLMNTEKELRDALQKEESAVLAEENKLTGGINRIAELFDKSKEQIQAFEQNIEKVKLANKKFMMTFNFITDNSFGTLKGRMIIKDINTPNANLGVRVSMLFDNWHIDEITVKLSKFRQYIIARTGPWNVFICADKIEQKTVTAKIFNTSGETETGITCFANAYYKYELNDTHSLYAGISVFFTTTGFTSVLGERFNFQFNINFGVFETKDDITSELFL